MSLAVVGTDTEVGKTVVSALVARRYWEVAGIAYWKPVATGVEPLAAMSGDSGSVADLVDPRVTVLAETYAFEDPVSPHLAARRTGEVVSIGRLDRELAAHRAQGRRMVVEGIGGVLVPLDDAGTLFADWLARTGLPALVVARSSLGTINHSLLTLEALRRRGVALAGVVVNGRRDAENRRAIERFGSVAPVFELEPIEPLDRSALGAYAANFDPDAVLGVYFQSP